MADDSIDTLALDLCRAHGDRGDITAWRRILDRAADEPHRFVDLFAGLEPSLASRAWAAAGRLRVARLSVADHATTLRALDLAGECTP